MNHSCAIKIAQELNQYNKSSSTKNDKNIVCVTVHALRKQQPDYPLRQNSLQSTTRVAKLS